MAIQQLSLVLFVEGDTDTRFLSIIVQRTAQTILSRRAQKIIEVPEDLICVTKTQYKSYGNEKDKILQIARDYAHSHALIIHSDADAPTRDKAVENHFQPAYELIKREKEQNQFICNYLLPIIPVRNIEAWMMVDGKILGELLNSDLSNLELGLPDKSKEVEAIANPKETITRIVEKVNKAKSRSRKRTITLASLYQPLAKQLRLAELEKVPAYKLFVEDLTQTFIDLGLIQTQNRVNTSVSKIRLVFA